MKNKEYIAMSNFDFLNNLLQQYLMLNNNPLQQPITQSILL